jgi:hypothetical protein
MTQEEKQELILTFVNGPLKEYLTGDISYSKFKELVNETCGTNFKYSDIYPSYLFNAGLKIYHMNEEEMKYKATVYYNETYEKVMEFEIEVEIPDNTDIDDHANLIYNTIENEAHDKFDVLMEQDERLRYEIDDVTFQKIE